MKSILFSIIVPVYNAEKYLENCINSIRNQSYENLEILLINDGSTDGSSKICDKHAKEDRRVIVIHKKNGGVSSARNLGLEKCRGDYILFVDSDDWIERTTISSLINIEAYNGFDIIMFGFYNENAIINSVKAVSQNETRLNSKEEIFRILPELIKDERINAVWNKLYKSRIIKDNNIYFDESINNGEDLLFNYQVFNKINSMHISSKTLYHYITRDNNSLTKQLNFNKYNILMDTNNKIMALVENKNNYIEIKKAIQQIRIKNIYSCLLDIFHKDNSRSYHESKEYIKNIIYSENVDNYFFDNVKYRILTFILNTKNISLVYLFTYIIYKFKRIRC